MVVVVFAIRPDWLVEMICPTPGSLAHQLSVWFDMLAAFLADMG